MTSDDSDQDRRSRSRQRKRNHQRERSSKSERRSRRERKRLKKTRRSRRNTRSSSSSTLDRGIPSDNAPNINAGKSHEETLHQVVDQHLSWQTQQRQHREVPEQAAQALEIQAVQSTAALSQLQGSEQTLNNVTNSKVMNSPIMTINTGEFATLLQNLIRPAAHGISYDKNIIPFFDPAQKNQSIGSWLAKVNECAKIYKWTDEQTTHFALPKLVGHAKKWYEGLQTILLTWTEWQTRLSKAFPSESNYGELLTEMLERRMKMGESVDDYYFDKITLLNACDIKGKKAVDCLIYGMDDRMLRASASSARLNDSEDLLKFLKDLGEESSSRFGRNKSNTVGFKEIICYNCKDKGHTSNNCIKPLVKCDSCHRIGHTSTDCFQNSSNINTKDNTKSSDKRTMLTRSSKSDTKFRKQAVINSNIQVECYINFGSDCTLISREVVDENSLPKSEKDLPAIRGFGNNSYTPLGRTKITLKLGEVTAEIDAYIVEPSMLVEPLLVGQNFTERSDVLVIKTSEQLDILKRKLSPELTLLPVEDDLKLQEG